MRGVYASLHSRGVVGGATPLLNPRGAHFAQLHVSMSTSSEVTTGICEGVSTNEIEVFVVSVVSPLY